MTRPSRDLWEEHAGWWIDGFTGGRRRRVRGADPAVRGAELAGYERVLDVGLRRRSDQPTARRQPGANVVGIDPTWNQISVARERGGGPAYVRAASRRAAVRRRQLRRRASPASCSSTSTTSTTRSPRSPACVRPGGRFSFFLNHPLLQTPGSGWIDDHIARSARAVLADRAVPRRGGVDRAGRARACSSASSIARCRRTSTRCRERAGARADGRARPAGRLPRARRRVRRARRRSRACCTCACAESDVRFVPARPNDPCQAGPRTNRFVLARPRTNRVPVPRPGIVVSHRVTTWPTSS